MHTHPPWHRAHFSAYWSLTPVLETPSRRGAVARAQSRIGSGGPPPPPGRLHLPRRPSSSGPPAQREVAAGRREDSARVESYRLLGSLVLSSGNRPQPPHLLPPRCSSQPNLPVSASKPTAVALRQVPVSKRARHHVAELLRYGTPCSPSAHWSTTSWRGQVPAAERARGWLGQVEEQAAAPACMAAAPGRPRRAPRSRSRRPRSCLACARSAARTTKDLSPAPAVPPCRWSGVQERRGHGGARRARQSEADTEERSQGWGRVALGLLALPRRPRPPPSALDSFASQWGLVARRGSSAGAVRAA